MKKVMLPLLLLAFASCQKSNAPISNNIHNAKTTPSVTAQRPVVVITAGVRLYRPKYGCEHRLSLCIGRVRHNNTSLYEESALFLPDEQVGDTTVRLGDTKIALNADKTEMTIQFLNDFDKSEGTTFVIDDGYNIFDLEPELLDSLGVNSITMQSGSYDLANYNLSLGQFGTLTIPVTTD